MTPGRKVEGMLVLIMGRLLDARVPEPEAIDYTSSALVRALRSDSDIVDSLMGEYETLILNGIPCASPPRGLLS